VQSLELQRVVHVVRHKLATVLGPQQSLLDCI
jgi:hypothetical protein